MDSSQGSLGVLTRSSLGRVDLLRDTSCVLLSPTKRGPGCRMFVEKTSFKWYTMLKFDNDESGRFCNKPELYYL